MSSNVPDLDTTAFEQLVETARGLIPRYAPDWTDHNLHDPGMTLIDLLAWIVDQQVYRVGFVSDRLKEAFAAVLGVRIGGPKAARGLVWPDRPVVSGISLKAGEEVTCKRHAGIRFMLEDHLYISDAEMDGTALVDGGVEVALSLARASAASLVLAPSRSGGTVSLVMRFTRPLVAVGNYPISVGFEVVPLPGEPPSKEHTWGPLYFEYRIGDGDWLPVEVAEDRTSALAVTGLVLLEVPGSDATDRSELRLSLDRGLFPIAPRVRRVGINVLSVVQQHLEPRSVIAKGTGLPGQEVPLDTESLVPFRDRDALVIEVSGEEWQRVEDLEDSGPDDVHYVQLPDRLVFGNGVNGQIPKQGAQIAHAAFARTLGGEGNLRADLEWTVPKIQGGLQIYGRNPAPLRGGSRGQTIEEVLAGARDVATRRQVALTNADLRRAALQLPGFAVGRSEVLAGFETNLPGARIDGQRTLVVLPHRDPSVDPRPLPLAYFEAMSRALRKHRVLGERLVVKGPQYADVTAQLSVIIDAGADPNLVEEAIRRRLRQRLSDLRFVEEVDPWPLGRPVTVFEIKTIAAQVDGVLAVAACQIARVGDRLGVEPIEIPGDGVAVAFGDDSIRIDVQVALGAAGEVVS